MRVSPVKTRIFRESGDLVAFIKQHVSKLKNGSILAVTSKIVALAEGRVMKVKGKSQKAKVIRAESTWAMKTKYVWLTMKDGMLLANAGVDASNAGGRLILLPKDSFASARELKRKLAQLYKVKLMGVVITDSRVMPLRAGVTGVALGYAGFKGLRDYRSKKDIFGRKLKFTQTNVADSLATAAALAMGEGRERQPLCIIEDAPVEFTSRVDGFDRLTARRNELRIPFKDDMYRPLFQRKLR